MMLKRHRYYEVDQLIGCQLNEDWTGEFDDVYEAAEQWVLSSQDDVLTALVGEIDEMLNVEPNAEGRLELFDNYAFRSAEAFDVWLRAVRERAAEAVAGIHHHPLVDPPA